MACGLDGAKPLSEPMLKYCLLDPWEQTLVKSQLKSRHFHSKKFIWKCRLENGGHCVSASMNVLKKYTDVRRKIDPDTSIFIEMIEEN